MLIRLLLRVAMLVAALLVGSTLGDRPPEADAAPMHAQLSMAPIAAP